MKRATPILIVLVCASITQAFTGHLEATVRVVKSGVFETRQVVMDVDGDRWRMETTWLNGTKRTVMVPVKDKPGEKEPWDTQLASYSIETVDDNGYTYYAPEYRMMVVHLGRETRFAKTVPWTLALYEAGQTEASYETSNGDEVFVEWTKADLTKPNPGVFTIRPALDTNVETFTPDGKSERSKVTTIGQVPRTNLASGWACADHCQTYEIDLCSTNGCECWGWYAVFYDRWCCTAVPWDESCYNVLLPRLSEIMCDHQDCQCIPKGYWYTAPMPACN